MSTKSQKEYEQLGKIVASVYESGYLDKGKTYKMSFLKGILQGLGGVVGATVGIAVFLWVLSLFGELPLVGRFFDSARETINQ